jgi:ABC-type nitrate/sulfonate/bicarbonate transport system substrate-binding protein
MLPHSKEDSCMQWSRRHFLSASAAAALAAGWHRRADAQSGKPITVSHSVSTFVYGQHLVAREKKFFAW